MSIIIQKSFGIEINVVLSEGKRLKVGSSTLTGALIL
jgi:hypothetical protein